MATKLPKRVRSNAHEVMPMPLKSVAKERHRVRRPSTLKIVAEVCVAAGLDRQVCHVEPQTWQRALLGLTACPQCLHRVGRKCPLASALTLLRGEVALHLLQ